MHHMTLSEELTWRGFVNQTTYKDITALDSDPVNFYLGVDPSADSMTIGHLAMMMMVRHFIEHGHKAILLVGGATGMIGDPDGKKQERDLLTLEQIDSNKRAIAAQYKQVLGEMPFELVDNYEWFGRMGYLEFLRDIGKHVPMRQMLGREFVQNRLREGGAGISYAEFSYSLIQGYDFLHLHREQKVDLQVCGADQWGNSIAGVELIRRVTGDEAHVWSAPLVVNKTTGVKFGKTEAGAVWLDANKTSVYDFYQFWLNVDDEGVEGYLKIFTLLSKSDIEQIMHEFNADKGARKAQKTLAYEVTKLVHGQEEVESAMRITDSLFGKDNYHELTAKDIDTLKNMLPTYRAVHGEDIATITAGSGLVTSKGEARRLGLQGALYLNGKTVGAEHTISREDGVASGSALLKKGKNSFAVIDIADN